MKLFLTLLAVLITFNLYAEKQNRKSLTRAVMALDRALMGSDVDRLTQLLSDSVTYGHTNGWIQRKSEVIGDLLNGKIAYKEINMQSHSVALDGEIAWVRMVDDIDAIYYGTPVKMKVNILQVWMWKEQHWQLFAEQSVKVD